MLSRQIFLTKFFKVILPHNYGLHVHHRFRPRRDLLCVASERFHLHMGGRKRGAEIRSVLWLSRRLVVDHGLDDVHCWKLPGKLQRADGYRTRSPRL